MKTKSLASAIALALVLASSAARADDATTERARTFFNAGAQAYASGKYADAVRSFEQAYALAPRPTVLFSLAQAERKDFYDRADATALHHAIAHYTEYLKAVPSGGRRAEAQDAKTELEGRLARMDPKEAAATTQEKRKPRLTVFSATAGAQVSIDGGAPSELPYFADLEPGKHKVRVFAEGYFDREQEVSGDKGDEPVNLPLQEKPALVTVELSTESDVYVDGHLVAQTPIHRPLEVPSGVHVIAISKNGHRAWSREVMLERAKPLELRPELQVSGQRVLAITMIAGGGALVGLGALFAIGAFAEQKTAKDIENHQGPIDEQTRQDHNDAIDRRGADRAGAILFGVTGAAIVTGGILFFAFDHPTISLLPPRTTEQKAPPPGPMDVSQVRLVPTVGPGLYGAGLTATF
jgi:hypothetical protein